MQKLAVRLPLAWILALGRSASHAGRVRFGERTCIR